MKLEKSLLPYLSLYDVDRDLIWGHDGQVTLLFELEAYHEPGMTDEEVNQRAHQADHAWNETIPEGGTYQFLVFADEHRGRAQVEAGLPPIEVVDERTRILERYRASRLRQLLHADERGGAEAAVLERRHFFAASFRPRVLTPTWRRNPVGKVRDVLGLTPRPSLLGSGVVKTLKAVLAEAAAFERRVMRALWQMGLSFRRCPTEEILSLLYTLLNPRASRYNDLRKLCTRVVVEEAVAGPLSGMEDCYSHLSPLVDDDYEVEWDHLRVGDQHVAVVSLKQLPTSLEPGALASLVALGRRRYVISYRILKRNQEDEKKELAVKGQLSNALRIQDWFVQTDRKDAAADAIGKQSDEALELSIAAGQRIFRVSVQVALYEESAPRLDEACGDAIGKMAEAHGLRAYREGPGLLEAYLALVPGSRPVARPCTAMVPVMVDLLPCWDCRPSKGVVPFRSSRNTAVWLDLFDTSVNQNANALVVGTAGAGKSFVVSTLLLGYRIAAACQGLPPPHMYAVDCGGSYDRLLRVCSDGVSRGFEADAATGIDPFDWSPADGPLMDHISRLTWLLVDLFQVSEGDRERFLRVQSIVERALQHVYGQGLQRGFEGLGAGLDVVGGDEASRLRETLWLFKEGRLARLFRPDPRLALSDDVRAVGFDFQALKGKPDEAAVALKLVVFEIRRRTAKLHRARVRSLVVFDESWMLLSEESGQKGVVEAAGPFMSESARQARKEGGALLALSQDLATFFKCPWGHALVGNSATKFLGVPGSATEVEDAREVLGLTARQVAQLSRLRRSPVWHEFLVVQGSGGPTGRSDVVQVTGDPLSRWTFGTAPAERQRIAQVEAERPELDLFSQIELLAEGA